VDIYNCNNGARFSTYVIKGNKSEICLNGAAARHVQKGDLVIICSYCGLSFEEAKKHQPTVVFVDEKNQFKERRKEDVKNNKPSKK
jgi:aspartate 1-decarboxylase